jgi:arginyl-tRNA synthetase
MEEILKTLIGDAARNLYGINDVAFSVEHPKEINHGDYATNIALVISKQLGKSPIEVAKEILAYLQDHKPEEVENFSIAGPGFINIQLVRSFFSKEIGNALAPIYANNALWAGKRIMVEYTDPNPFKPFHIGHLMTNAIGESIARILDASGASVIRANYQGDVGRHVAMAIYGLMQKGKPEGMSVSEQAKYIGECYVFGNNEYEQNEEAKKEINSINKKVYERTDEEINALYDWGREVTLEAFEELYKVLGTKFDYYFFESEMASKGKALVEEYKEKKVFTESEGAIVFKAEEYNPKLHTRVFITNQGLPTYEAKEIGLTITKFEKERLDKSIVITADEQKDYMAVATEAIKQMHPEYAEKMHHITHGMMRFASGKMSSRKGNVITGESLLEDAKELAYEKMKDREIENREKNAELVGVAAIKYAILRQSIGGNIVYDEKQSVSFEGDSGPYLQYTATRANSVLLKAHANNIFESIAQSPDAPYEIEKILYRFPEVVLKASTELEPHHIVTYLTELASAFNSFYTIEPIADPNDEYAPYKVAITKAVHTILVKGLELIGISVPEKM